MRRNSDGQRSPVLLPARFGFSKNPRPCFDALNKSSAGPPVTITHQAVTQLIASKAKKLREEIRAEVAGKLVSMKADTCTRLDRHLMGVNIQFVKDGKLCLRNLGIREFLSSHTGENMKKEILEILEKFGLGAKDLYTCTADNAANIQKTNELIDQEARTTLNKDELDCECLYVSAIFDRPEEERRERSFPGSGSFSDERREAGAEKNKSNEDVMDEDTSASSSDESGGIDDLCEEDTSWDDVENSENHRDKRAPEENRTGTSTPLRCPECVLIKTVMAEMGVYGVRCSAHTLQLAVEDALKACPRFKDTISKARKLCKTLRIPTLAAELTKRGCNKIGTEGETRWHSLYDMLSSLLKAQPVCGQIAEDIRNKKIKSAAIKRNFRNLSDSEWQDINDVCKTLEPARTTTKILQGQQLTVGDFYGAWLECKLKTKSQGNDLATALVEAMETREAKLLSTPVIAAALYLDPRYKVMLTSAMDEVAVKHLQALWLRLHPIDAQPEVSETEEETDDPVEQLMREKTRRRRDQNRPQERCTLARLAEHLRRIQDWPRLPRDSNILDFWERKRYLEPELYELAEVVLAVPMTQVSVESSFSHLKHVVSVLRYSLSASLIEDILLLRCNHFYQKKSL